MGSCSKSYSNLDRRIIMKKKISFQFDGKTYKVDVERKGNELLINNEGKAYSVILLEEERPKPAVQTAPAPAPVQSAAPRSSAPVQAAAAPGDLAAPMTGTIKEVKVSKGDSVQKGTLVMIMEAMKMDIEVFAPGAGTVQNIFVNPGDAVKENQRLLHIQ